MADDRMKKDDLNRKMGGTEREGQDFGKETPGRNPQGGQAGQQGAGQQGGGQQREPRNVETDDDFGTGGAGKTGGQNR